MGKQDLHQAGEGLVDAITVPGGDLGGKAIQSFVAIREVVVAQRAQDFG